MLAFARTSWLIQSALNVCTQRCKHRKVEIPLLFLPHACFLFLSFGFLNLPAGISFFLVSQCVGGILLGLTFLVNHNGRSVFPSNDVVEGRMDFNKIQVLTGRDIRGGPRNFFHWFMGGLDMQIEHHLFPSLPRHYLKGIQSKVTALCKQYEIEHHQTSLREVLQQPKLVSRSATGKLK